MFKTKKTSPVYSVFYHVFIFLVGTVFMLLLAQNCMILQDWAAIFSSDGLVVFVFFILTALCWMRDTSLLAKVSFAAWLSCFVVIIVVVLNMLLLAGKGDLPKGENAAKLVNLPVGGGVV